MGAAGLRALHVVAADTLVAAALFVFPPAPAAPSPASGGLTVSATMPATVAAGQHAVAGTVTVRNRAGSGGHDLRLTGISYVPSCRGQRTTVTGDCAASARPGSKTGNASDARAVSPSAPDPDKDAGLLAPVGQWTGASGSVCAGVPFTLLPMDDATGQVELVPGAPVTLLPAGDAAVSTCTVDLTLDVAPAATAGLTLTQLAMARAVSPPGSIYQASGSSALTIMPWPSSTTPGASTTITSPASKPVRQALRPNVGIGQNGFAVSAFATNFPDPVSTGDGPIGLAFDKLGELYVGDYDNGDVYRFPPTGGDASANLLSATPVGTSLDGMAFSKSGRLYAILQAQGAIVELDPNTGEVLRTVVNGPFSCGLETDPISGDLFAMGCGGSLNRVSNFEGPGQITTATYTSVGGDGFAFASDGTIFMTVNRADGSNGIDEVAGTNSATPGAITTITQNGPPSLDGLAVIKPPAGAPVTQLVANRNDGTVTLVDFADLANVTETDIVTGGTRGDFVTTDASGCLYITQTAEVDKITKADGSCPFEPVPVFSTSAPTLSTQSTSALFGTAAAQVTDTATLSQGHSPTGTISFNLFGANDPTCSSDAIFSSVKTVTGNGTYTSDPFSTTSTGNFHWEASYSGDPGNAAVTSACGDQGETSSVQAQPTLSTTASGPAPPGGPISDTATLAGGANVPQGTITFTVYGPNDPSCSNPPFGQASTSVDGNGTYPSPDFAPIVPGSYQFVATYGGDTNNGAVSTACNDPNETVTVRATPTVTTSATQQAGLGGSISDRATVTGGIAPTGTITFNLYGPNVTSCDGTATFTSTVDVSGDGSYPSKAFIPTAVGTYLWVADYSGDGGNMPVGTNCGDPAETSTVGAGPNLTTSASPATVALGGATVSDTATLTGGLGPSGTITFSLYGPNDTSCSGVPAFTGMDFVNGDGIYTSGPFAPAAPGVYRFVASYSGDSANPAVSTACNDSAEMVTVTLATPALTTQASGPVTVGQAISDTATLAGGFQPGGTISFSVFGPGDPTCGGTAAFNANKSVDGAGNYPSSLFSPTAPGTYLWVASYSGDANNAPATSPCGSAGESVTVAATTTTTSTTVGSTTTTTVGPTTTTTVAPTTTTVRPTTTTTVASTTTTTMASTTTTVAPTTTTVRPTTTTVASTTTTVAPTTTLPPTTTTLPPPTTTTTTTSPPPTTTTTGPPPTVPPTIPPTTVRPTSTTVRPTTTTVRRTTTTVRPTTTVAPTTSSSSSTSSTSSTSTVPPTTVPPTTASPPPPESMNLQLDHVSTPPGGEVTAKGHGCVAGSAVTLLLGNNVTGNALADGSGNFAAPLRFNVPLGHYIVTAKCGVTLTAAIDVVLSSQAQTPASTASVLLVLLLLIFIAVATQFPTR